MSSSQITTHELWTEGRAQTVSVTKLTPTSLRLTWNIPATPKAWAGNIVLLSEERFSPAEFPEDGTRYTASTNFAVPADVIGSAKVVFAAYKFFNEDTSIISVDVFNVDPAKLYYASIHAASSVLQYFPQGTQSYPLESSRIEKLSDTYAGSIPASATPPLNPTNGQIYYDAGSNVVLVWNDSISTWVQANQKTTPSWDKPPILKNQLFFNRIGDELKFFDGTVWNVCDGSNTRVKFGGAWIPFNSAASMADFPATPTPGDFAYVKFKGMTGSPGGASLKVFTSGTWFIPVPGLVEILTTTGWAPIAIGNFLYGEVDPGIPDLGDFYYDTTRKDLMVWNKVEWTKADTEDEGAPTTDKVGIGSDGSYDDRLRLIKILQHQLGYPQVCVELSEEQFNVAIDNALDEFRRRADNAYTNRFISFTVKRGQTNYYLNDPRDKTDKIVNVMKIHRVNFLGSSLASSENGLYAQAFYNQLYQGSNVDLLSIHLMHQLSESFEKIFAGNLMFTWDEASRQLLILRNIQKEEERVVLEVVMERTEQELLLDRWAKQWLQAWAESELLEMLGMIRSKYGTLPGPGGGITLNGDALIAMAAEKQTELLRQIADFEVGNGVNFGNWSFLVG